MIETSVGPTPAAQHSPETGESLALSLARPMPDDPPLARRVRDTLAELSALGAEPDVLAAAVLYWLPERASGLSLETRSKLPGIDTVLDGLRAADRIPQLYRERDGGGDPEGLRRLLLSIVRDPRVVPVLLACQLSRLRQAASLGEPERQELARLTADIHAPLANRLGIWQLKWELEDWAFRILHSETYRRIADLLDEKRADREAFIETCKKRIGDALREAGIEAEITGRPKHIYSIYKKMQRKHVPFGELYDIRAVRVLVDSVPDCYAALGLVHALWTPVPGEFDDYIAKPKGNDYRSLHTALVGPQGKTLEVQIRTRQMHEQAELGVAAHWRYKEGGSGVDAGFERRIAWMRQLLETNEGESGGQLMAGLESALAEDRVYLLTPRGEVIDLPLSGTVLDFAYHVHTEVGHRCRGAKVNGRIVPLSHQPRTGDRVEILTGKESAPRRDWLMTGSGYLASGRARDKVRAWFHRLDRARNIADGRDLLDKELRRLALLNADLEPVLPRFNVKSPDELMIALALGDVGPSQVARALHELEQAPEPAARQEPSTQRPPRPADNFVVEGVGNLLTQLARCCQPVAGDPICGYLTKSRGVSIHREDCPALAHLATEHPERILPVEWGRQGGASYSVMVIVSGIDRKGLLKDLTTLIAQAGAHVLSITSHLDSARGTAQIRLTLKVRDFEQLGGLLGRLGAVPGVHEARRV